jgi:hypothetical protein
VSQQVVIVGEEYLIERIYGERINDSGGLDTVNGLVNGYTVGLIKRAAIPNDMFSVSRVGKDGTELWAFRDEVDMSARGYKKAFLTIFDGQLFVAVLVSSESRWQLGKIVWIEGLENGEQLSVRESIEVKRLLAAALTVFLKTKCSAMFSLGEERYLAREAKKWREEQDRLAEEKRQRDEEARLERLARIMEINARQPIMVYAANGYFLTGIPVTGDEWLSIDEGGYAVIGLPGETFDAAYRDPEAPLVHCRVMRQGTKRYQKNPQPVMLTRPKLRASKAAPQGAEVFEIQGEIFEIPVYADVKPSLLREQGTKGFVAIKSADGKYSVYQIGEEIQSVPDVKIFTV